MNILETRKKQTYELLKSLTSDYSFLLNNNDLMLIESVNDNNFNSIEIIDKLSKITEKVWNYELSTDEYIIVSWNKTVSGPNRSTVTFATISKKDEIISFCDSTEGIQYEINYDAIIGGCPKDGATLLQDSENEYTIANINGKAINSYNGATRLITPKQMITLEETDYKRRYNELILDSSKIKEIGVFEKNEHTK